MSLKYVPWSSSLSASLRCTFMCSSGWWPAVSSVAPRGRPTSEVSEPFHIASTSDDDLISSLPSSHLNISIRCATLASDFRHILDTASAFTLSLDHLGGRLRKTVLPTLANYYTSSRVSHTTSASGKMSLECPECGAGVSPFCF